MPEKNLSAQAVPTFYNGYRFRSRLEARWAVFFDALHVDYDYEREGFDLGDLGWYLPDFWLPQAERWIEIKPGIPTVLEQARAKALACLSKQIVDIHLGIPAPEDIVCPGKVQLLHCYPLSDPPGYQEWLDLHAYAHGWFPALRTQCQWPALEGYQYITSLCQAAVAARSARFEHGESGFQEHTWGVSPRPGPRPSYAERIMAREQAALGGATPINGPIAAQAEGAPNA